MKNTIQYLAFFILILFSNKIYAQDNKTRTDKIMAKAVKYGLLKDVDGLQAIEFATNNKAYYLTFNRNGTGVYFKDGNAEAYAVWGDIYKVYAYFLDGDIKKGKDGRITVSNRQLFIGAPTGDQFKTPQKDGAGQHFEGGSLYWSAKTGTHEVHGNIRDKWKALGWENSFLGFPVTNETATPDGYGKFNFFEGGCIYYHPNLGTFAVPKMIAEVWKKEGWEKGKLGYPISDEIIKNNNSIQKFEFGAVISTKSGAYQVIYNSEKNKRGLYTKWLETGAENSYLGDLVTPNRSYPKNPYQYFAEFQKGYIYESFIKGTNNVDAFVIRKGPIFDYYVSKKWEQGYLGLPISDEMSSKKSVEELREQAFQGGVIYYTQSMGAFEKKK